MTAAEIANAELAKIEAEIDEWWNSLTAEEQAAQIEASQEYSEDCLDNWIEASRRAGVFV